MKTFLFLMALLAGMTGCAPKMGKDVLIEPSGHLRWENTKSEIVLGIFSLLGGTAKAEAIRIGTDVKITNKWHSEMKLNSFKYSLMDGKQVLATGFACINSDKGFVVSPNTQRVLALTIQIDPKSITLNRVVAIMQEKRKMILSGEAVAEVWGVEYHYAFSRDATLLINKALNGKNQNE